MSHLIEIERVCRPSTDGEQGFLDIRPDGPWPQPLLFRFHPGRREVKIRHKGRDYVVCLARMLDHLDKG